MNMNFKNIISEVKKWTKELYSIKNSWILLPSILGVVSVMSWFCIKGEVDYNFYFFNKPNLEITALCLIGITAFVLLIKSIIVKNSLIIILCSIALSFLVRELDDTDFIINNLKTKKIIYVLLFVILVWCTFWQERLFSVLNKFRMIKISISGMVWTYVFSQIIARRAFRGILLNEKNLHVYYEEVTENLAHIFFLFVAILCCIYLKKEISEK